MEAQDIYGTRIRLTQDGLTVGEEFVPFAEMGGRQPESHVFWNPGTRALFIITEPVPLERCSEIR